MVAGNDRGTGPPVRNSDFGVKMTSKRTEESDDAAVQLYRLAQAQTMTDALLHEGSLPEYDRVTGTVTPTRKALDQVNGENPELFRASGQASSFPN
jgi:hypothetical protein